MWLAYKAVRDDCDQDDYVLRPYKHFIPSSPQFLYKRVERVHLLVDVFNRFGPEISI